MNTHCRSATTDRTCSARAFLAALWEAAGRPAKSRDDALDRDGRAAAIYVELRTEVIGAPVTRMTLWTLPDGARGL